MPPATRTRGSRPRRLGLLAAGTLALVAAATAVAPPAASAATVDTGASYVLVNRHSGKAMDLYGWSTADGAPINQYARNDLAVQQWRFVDVGSGYYQIRSAHSGKVLELPNALDGTALVQNPATSGNTRQHFRLVDSAGGYVRLLNRHSGKALDVWERSTADGAMISQYQDVDGANQQWQLARPGGTADCGSGAFQAEAVLSGGTWTVRNGGTTVHTGTDLRAAVQAGVNSLTAGRTSKQRVVVRGSGTMSANSRISLPSYTTLDVCGTINVTGTGSGDQAPVYSRGTTQVEVQHLTLTGTPLYGIFLRNVTNVVLGQLDMRLSAGLGVRIDNRGDTSQWTRNVRIDTVYVSGASSHAVETYGVDGLTIGTVTARNVGESGLLLNQTINATVSTVDAENAGTGTGYAAFRMANRNGRIGDSYPTNIRVGTVRAWGGGRGVFCVSESGGAIIDRIDIANTGNNAVLIENCYGVSLATSGGTISGGGEVRLAERTEFPGNRDLTLRNFTLVNNRIVENPCADNLTISNVTLTNSTISRC
ncbi:Ricin-type beta-trefoil lectin domain-like [Micromonospora matsumotoense]|uniref:Ricin-type beta-trefoil lectin domain-like n=1 Tax=Micromonospora matsumotoense TaxID=121616 RepID=A0A1C4VKZ5_9ACTN|nr:RICIN domain-containing protein [Micromonospora matsumotoense]SCE84495.1 Ricin-type beta-trefoil lectin domain-like [Micromonospora matsumotoense]